MVHIKKKSVKFLTQFRILDIPCSQPGKKHYTELQVQYDPKSVMHKRTGKKYIKTLTVMFHVIG